MSENTKPNNERPADLAVQDSVGGMARRLLNPAHLRDLAGRSVKTLREQGAEQLWRDVKFRVGLAMHHDDWRHRADIPLRRELKAQRAAHLQGPKISIIVPLYNTPAKLFDEMLQSVVRQTYTNWELVLVDASDADKRLERRLPKTVPGTIVYEPIENGGIALSQIANYYLGRMGTWILAIAITFACLKTSIGLVTSCAETFVKLFPHALSYRAWAVVFTLFSLIVSNVGLSAIITYSVPVLMLIYPPAITLILLALVGNAFQHDKKVYVCVTICSWAASIFDFLAALPYEMQSALHLEPVIAFARHTLPLFDLNLGWILPSLVGLCIGLLWRQKEKSADRSHLPVFPIS